MAKRNINVFGASFLDLLSGALGAVIILYIIVPKLTSDDQSLLDEVQNLSIELSEVNSLIEQLANSIEIELFNEIQERLQSMERRLSEFENQVRNLTNELQQTREENQRLTQDLEAAQSEISNLSEALAEAQQASSREADRIARLQDELEAAKTALAKTFLVIYIQWPTQSDIDLHVTDPTGAEFSYQNKRIPGRPGELSEDVTNGPGVEVWEILVADPGSYLIEANLYRKNTENNTVRGRIFYRDGSTPIEGVSLTQEGRKVTLIRFVVSGDGDVSFR